ncbi:alpha/beta fold hydrolase [Sphingomonas sp. CJ20]
MIRQLAYAALAAVTLPALLHPAPAMCQATTPARIIQMEHISAEVVGTGSPVILIPGLSSPRAVWEGVTPELAKTHRVYVIQVNGFGGDEPRANLKPGVLAGVVEELRALIAQEKLTGTAVVGHSMGGLVSLMLARAHPGDVQKALIVDALPFYSVVFAPAATAESIKPQAEMMRAQMTGFYGKPFPAQVAQMLAQQMALKPDAREKVAVWSMQADMRVSGQAVYEDMTTDVRADLPKIAAPITVMVPWSAARGEAATLDFYRAQYGGTPNLTIQGVPESGHFVMLDQPEAFRAALAAFLR